MSNLNLYNYYDKSLADVNKEYLETKNALKDKKSAAGRGKSLALALFAAVALAAPAGIYLGQKLSKTAQEVIHPPVPPKPDLRSTEEKLGYVKVQIFEFADEAQEKKPASYTEKKPKPAETAEAKQENIKNEPERKNETPAAAQVKNEPVKTEPAKKNEPAKTAAAVPVLQTGAAAEKKYSVVFESVNPQEYDTVNSLAVRFKFTPSITDSSSVPRTFWRVYRTSSSSGTVIGGKNVEKVKDFATKEEAIAYAKENNIQSVIRLEEEIDKTYTLKLCCGNMETSKELAEASNIRNKTIKIIREK